MLSKILSKSTCAECRVCCSFDNYDIWETPVISEALHGEILERSPLQKFVSKGGSYLFRMEKPDSEELFYCPMLTEKGCALGDDKPFDCRIWPFRIMNFCGKRVITLSPVCESVYGLPMRTLREAAEEIAPQIFAYADKNPDIVKSYIDSYPIILSEKSSI